uniref:Uncharacterized protein n=1 Tax=Rhizophagus irregularis (strain DAOM 181602 / DAOM 197198 / MUCL 43194) TaxID=747089 RepID=U9TNK3_RHIID
MSRKCLGGLRPGVQKFVFKPLENYIKIIDACIHNYLIREPTLKGPAENGNLAWRQMKVKNYVKNLF